MCRKWYKLSRRKHLGKGKERKGGEDQGRYYKKNNKDNPSQKYYIYKPQYTESPAYTSEGKRHTQNISW